MGNNKEAGGSHAKDRATHLTFAFVSKSPDIKANENSHTKTTDIQNQE